MLKGFKYILLAATAGAAIAATQAHADTISLNFDSLQEDELVNDYYNGGYGSLGSGPGPNYGISFENALVLNETVDNEGELITAPNSITFLGGGGALMNVAAGFTDGFSFDYSSPYDGGEVDVYSGLNGTGTLLATLDLPTTPAYNNGDPGCNGHAYCPDVPFGVSFSGVAESVNFSGTANYIVYDDITLGSATPITSAAPEPSEWALMIAGVALAGGALRLGRKRRLQSLSLA